MSPATVPAVGLELAGLSKAYGKQTIVEQLSLSVQPGELLVLVGPSGSGKSTLLRLIAGLIPHDAGSIRIGGQEVGHLPPDKRDIAMVFQSYALFPHLSIRDNLAFGMQARKQPRALIDARIAEVSAALALSSLLPRFPRQLSGGERQRVALGRAMLREPRLFLMDEPLSNLDAQLRVQTRAEILRLQARLGTTTIYVTHDQIEALSMGDRIGVLRGGVLEQLGTPREIYEQPCNLFVAGFVGSPAMNFLTVTVESEGLLRWQSADQLIDCAAAPTAAGRALTLGVRPEHVFLEGSRWAVGAQPPHALSAQVELVETAGDQLFLLLDVAGQSLLARAEPDFRVQRGERLRAWLHGPALHLFDPHSGLRLPPA